MLASIWIWTAATSEDLLGVFTFLSLTFAPAASIAPAPTPVTAAPAAWTAAATTPAAWPWPWAAGAMTAPSTTTPAAPAVGWFLADIVIHFRLISTITFLAATFRVFVTFKIVFLIG